MFGKLGWDAVPWHEPIVMVVTAGIFIGAFALLAFITYKKAWGPLWRDWFCTVDHKKIGIMYIILAVVMLFRGFADALMMTSQQAVSVMGVNGGEGYLHPEHFDQVFTAHGVIMIFFVATPLFTGLANIVMPLQIGARDMAYPFMNLVSLWFTISAAILVNLSLFIGQFAATGWVAYPPLSGIFYSPNVGVDYWIWSLQLSGVGTTLTAVNILATIIKMRAPGMTLMKMPTFTWTVFCTFFLGLVIFPILTAAIVLLTLDRYLDFHFFTGAAGGNQSLWVNLIWGWGHPEVYFLVLPAFGMISEITATFSRKRLFGYTSLVYATVVIMILSFLVWLHHFFTMGSGASVNSFFGIMTMFIAIPTGVKLYNWIFTMYKGRIVFSASMWWVMAMLLTFTVGGMTGVMLSIPTNDYVVHNSTFLVAHFHNTIIGGAVYGYFAGLTYWWPKFTGFKLNEKLGKWSAALWFVGFFVAWMPKYLSGFDGMTRRLYKVTDPSMAPYVYIAFLGALIIFAGIICMVVNIGWSFYKRKDPAYRDVTGDPWNARTLEWKTSSPPASYNFAVIPQVHDRDEFDYMKKQGYAFDRPAKVTDIHMPTSAWEGPVIGIFSLIFGFAFVWHIWWLVVVGFIGMIAPWWMRSFSKHKDYYIPAQEVADYENQYHDELDAAMRDPSFATRPLPSNSVN
ncbi:cbb3-type cytochrome c oxidase subunit I [Brackiella oedipodis]|uniref:cbb3-type cytochrome c oxidase subunit I n=1 Tax=Brackiella oedipodis TaxID=124225 RepID=UPI000683EB69|nr:cbb3-type cytochrome c oxidase subunit I [Brackiella oedipodis]